MDLPSFIDSDTAIQWLSTHNINKLCKIGGMYVSSFIAKSNKTYKSVPYLDFEGQKRYRLIDVFLIAKEYGLEITPPEQAQKATTIEHLDNEIRLKESRLAELGAAETLISPIQLLLGQRFPTLNELIANQAVLEQICGVYVLFDENVPTYIGQSEDIYRRISEHRKLKKFSGYACFRVNVEHLDIVESHYIHILRPRDNKMLPNGEMFAPLSSQKLLELACR